MFCQELSNRQRCVNRGFNVLEEQVCRSPHFRSLSSYRILQTPENFRWKSWLIVWRIGNSQCLDDWKTPSSCRAFLGRGEAGISAISFTQHVMGCCSCFPYFEREFITNSLLFFNLLHAKRDKTTHSITEPVIKIIQNVGALETK
jgi:hypothetical protein